MGEQYIVTVANLDRRQHFGPFDGVQAAVDYARDNIRPGRNWRIETLILPRPVTEEGGANRNPWIVLYRVHGDSALRSFPCKAFNGAHAEDLLRQALFGAATPVWTGMGNLEDVLKDYERHSGTAD